MKPTECDKSIVDAISNNNLQFFCAKKESLKEINSCLIAGDITPLMIAAAYANAKTIGILISKGADVYIMDSSKQSRRQESLPPKKAKKRRLR
jgi:ankyrin repeat protein